MHNDLTNCPRQEHYVVEVDGIRKSEHRIFIEALKHALELKRCYPRSDVKLRDANDNAPDSPVAKRRALDDRQSASWLRLM
jgi:hypothetical protein